MRTTYASDFASLQDLAAFKKAKAEGLSDGQAFAVGDNGLGCWGDSTSTDKTPMCALPYEDWFERFGKGSKARGAKVKVTLVEPAEPPTSNRKGMSTPPVATSVVCELRDTMPHRANCKNGCGIDLNPGALKALGLVSPVKVKVIWEWV